MQALPALRSRSERYTSILIRCDPSDNLMKSLRSAYLFTTNGALWLLLSEIANKELNTAYSYQLERHLFVRSLDQPQ